MKQNKIAACLLGIVVALLTCEVNAQDKFRDSIEGFLDDYPIQLTNESMHQRTQGKLNDWFLAVRELTQAGEDIIVRMNNDTLYTAGYTDLRKGPAVVGLRNPKKDRFVSIQVNDQRDFNVAAIWDADGDYAIIKPGQQAPAGTTPIETTSDFNLVIIRIEVRTPDDIPAAQKIFDTITFKGPEPGPIPKLDLLSRYSPPVRERSMEMINHWGQHSNPRWWFGRPDERGVRVSDLDRAVGILFAEGGPIAEHSTYDIFFYDDDGDQLRGENGTYTFTTKPPPVKAFWSVTVYDTERGGFLHPNPLNRHHLNNSLVKFNADGTVTFTLQQECGPDDLNCIPVPAGAFDVAWRYYRPKQELIDGKWTPPAPVLSRKTKKDQ